MNNQKKLPNFYIIGAPKCGTTSMAHWLGEHPQIFMSDPKEPHFFSTDLANRSVRSWNDYLSLFENAESTHIAIGEASTWYLYSREAIQNIEKRTPGARYIVMTRDPAEMAFSLYLHNRRKLHEDCSTFDIAWNKQSLRSQGISIPKSCAEPAFLQYREVCSLSTMMERLFDQIPKNRVLHLSLDSVRTDPRREYLRVLEFLQVDDDERVSFPVHNKARRLRNRTVEKLLQSGSRVKKLLGIIKPLGIRNLNQNRNDVPTMPQDIYKHLREEFSDEYEKIEALNLVSKLTGTE